MLTEQQEQALKCFKFMTSTLQSESDALEIVLTPLSKYGLFEMQMGYANPR